MTFAAARRRRGDPTAAVVVGVIAAALVVAAVVGVVGSDRDEPTDARSAPADAWVAATEQAFTPFEELPEVLQTLDEWRRGEADPATATEGLLALQEALAPVAPALVDLGPHPDAPLAAPLHLATAQLYEIGIDVQLVAVAMPANDAGRQIDLAARRLAVLANRAFDRGRAAVGEGPAADIGPGVIVHRPEPVPSWPDEGLAAGPPLVSGTPEPTPATGGPVADWPTALRSTAPDLGGFEARLAAGDTDGLLVFADQLEAAVTAVRHVSDPGGGDRSTRVLLGLLLRVEAARLAAVATIVDQPELRAAASSVASVASGSAFWDEALGPRP